MLSPKIVPYQPNAAVRSRRIDAEDWEKRRPRLEQLYIKDDKKLEEVMEIMALYDSFHASRRQYTQKFKYWGLCKNIPAKVMKSALRKRARAGEVDVSIKYRGTAISGENMDRWQQRVPTFNPMSSPTASTPSQMIVESPQVVTSGQQGETLRSPVVQSPSMNVSDDGRSDDIDNMVSIAYDEIRRSSSPQLADYIFRPTTNKSSFTHNDSTPVRGLDHILNISMTELELRQLSVELLTTLINLGKNLWSFGKYEHLNCCLHIEEILIAWLRLFRPEQVDDMYKRMRNVFYIYMRMNRTAECERLLTDVRVVISSLKPGHPAAADFRLLLGRTRLQQGNHTLAEELCSQVIIPLRANTGLAHHMTWNAHYSLCIVLEAQGRFDDGRRLMMSLYQDVYRTVSVKSLPGLSTCLEMCRGYIEGWMHESKLQRIIKDTFMSDRPLGVGETHALNLITVLHEGYKEERKLRKHSQSLEDVEDALGLSVYDILSNFAEMIARRIQVLRTLGSISLQREALRVLNDPKFTKYLMPLLVLTCSTRPDLWGDWVEAERDLVKSLKDVVVDGGHYTKATTSAPDFAIATNLHILQADLLNDSERTLLSTATGQSSTAETYTGTLWLHNGNVMPSVLPSPTLVQHGPQLTSASIQVPSLVSSDHMVSFTHPTMLAWNTELSVPRSLSPAEISSNEISHNLFSPSTAFSQPPPAAQGRQPFDNAPPQTRFSPMMMATPTPPFMSSLPQTPRSLRMSPPGRPGEDGPAVPPSSILAGRADFPASPNLFGSPQSPLAPSPSLHLGPSPWPLQLP